MSMAVVIDGAYYIRRFHHSFPKLDRTNPNHLAFGVAALADWHLCERLNTMSAYRSTGVTAFFENSATIAEDAELYRIFFYDCAPMSKRMHLPVSKRSIDWSKTPEAIIRSDLHQRILRTRKAALRLGRLNEQFAQWQAKPRAVEKWLKEPTEFAPSDSDFEISVVQKGVDMRLGLDIASMAYKKQIDQLVMVASDADFVPPAKLARREGIDVVLDPMQGPVARDLEEHVDGVRSCLIEFDAAQLGLPNA